MTCSAKNMKLFVRSVGRSNADCTLFCKLKPEWLEFGTICFLGEQKLFLLVNSCWTAVKLLSLVIGREK